MKQPYKKRVSILKKIKESRKSGKGTTFTELAIVLVIIGILTAGWLTAKNFSEKAQINGVIKQINRVAEAYSIYKEMNHGNLPGDNPDEASNPGDGNKKIQGSEINNVLPHLRKSGVLTAEPSALNSGCIKADYGDNTCFLPGYLTTRGNNLRFIRALPSNGQKPAVMGDVARIIDDKIGDGKMNVNPQSQDSMWSDNGTGRALGGGSCTGTEVDSDNYDKNCEYSLATCYGFSPTCSGDSGGGAGVGGVSGGAGGCSATEGEGGGCNLSGGLCCAPGFECVTDYGVGNCITDGPGTCTLNGNSCSGGASGGGGGCPAPSCKGDVVVGGDCCNHEDCQLGNKCIANVCTDCVNAPNMEMNCACGGNNDCAGDCAPGCGDGTNGVIGTCTGSGSCTVDADCSVGQICCSNVHSVNFQTCVANNPANCCGANATPCAANGDCCSNNCISGTCGVSYSWNQACCFASAALQKQNPLASLIVPECYAVAGPGCILCCQDYNGDTDHNDPDILLYCTGQCNTGCSSGGGSGDFCNDMLDNAPCAPGLVCGNGSLCSAAAGLCGGEGGFVGDGSAEDTPCNSCFDNDDCIDGKVCSSSLCQPPTLNAYGGCTGNPECPDAMTCSASQCNPSSTNNDTCRAIYVSGVGTATPDADCAAACLISANVTSYYYNIFNGGSNVICVCGRKNSCTAEQVCETYLNAGCSCTGHECTSP